MERLSTEELTTEGRGPTADGRRPTASGRYVLGRYLLQRRLGAGGYGVVWLAWDEKLEREVAVKVIAREDGGPAPARAEREARVAAKLNHPGIVSLYELGGDDEAVYIVSELVRGRTYGELLKGGALSDRDVARIGIALCDALAHAHSKGVIHRDVKPQNIMVVAEPAAGAGFAKLADFGVAHLAGGDVLTRTGDVVGTLAYMAPEQAEGERVTEAVDVYSLALTLYEGWTGSNPHRARGVAATARSLGRPLPRLGGQRRDLPGRLCQAVDAALDPRPERRPALEVLRHALEHTAAELSEEGGLVEPATLRRFGLAEGDRRDLRFERPAWTERAAAGAGAGTLVLLALELLGPEPPVSPVAAAGAAALAVALLPRVGWLASAVALLGWLAVPGGGHEAGTALVIAVAVAVVPLLLPRAGPLWSLPALAPLLGTIGLAPMFVAVAGLVPGAWRRAGVATAGFVWLVSAEAVTGKALLYGSADGTRPRGDWDGSVTGAAAHAIWPALSSPALAPLVVWAVFAAVMPLLVHGRSIVLDLILGGIWAAGLVVALHGTDELLAASARLSAAKGAVAGSALGCVVAVAAATVRPRVPPVTAPSLP